MIREMGRAAAAYPSRVPREYPLPRAHDRARHRIDAMRDACEAKQAVAAKHPSRFREKLRNGWLRKQIEHIGADDSINADVSHRNGGLHTSDCHGGARSEGGQARTCNPHHGRADVHAVVHAALREPMLQKLQREASRTAPELEHRLGALKIAVRNEFVERARLVEDLAVLPATESIVERPRLFGCQRPQIGDFRMPNDGDDLGLTAERSVIFLRLCAAAARRRSNDAYSELATQIFERAAVE
jgi:hypothetical protein